MSNRYYKVLTEKGLRYVLNHTHDQAVIIAVKKELERRGLPLAQAPQPQPDRTPPVVDWEKEHWLK